MVWQNEHYKDNTRIYKTPDGPTRSIKEFIITYLTKIVVKKDQKTKQVTYSQTVGLYILYLWRRASGVNPTVLMMLTDQLSVCLDPIRSWLSVYYLFSTHSESGKNYTLRGFCLSIWGLLHTVNSEDRKQGIQHVKIILTL